MGPSIISIHTRTSISLAQPGPYSLYEHSSSAPPNAQSGYNHSVQSPRLTPMSIVPLYPLNRSSCYDLFPTLLHSHKFI
jgi:hypothetical protein